MPNTLKRSFTESSIPYINTVENVSELDTDASYDGNDESSDNFDDDDIDDDDKDETDNDNINDNNKKSLKFNEKFCEYFDDNDSDDSQFEAVDDIFPVKILRKIQRHNPTSTPLEIANKYTNQIKKMTLKYKFYVKNKNKNINLELYKNNLLECEELEFMLHTAIEEDGDKFNFDTFMDKYFAIYYGKSDEMEQDQDKGLEKINDKPIVIDLAKLFGLQVDNDEEEYEQPNKKSKVLTQDEEFKQLYEKDNLNNKSTLKYFKSLTKEQKEEYLETLRKLKSKENTDLPTYMRILKLETSDNNKNILLQKLTSYENAVNAGGSNNKMKTWLNKALDVPYGVYSKPPVSKKDSPKIIKNYLKNVKDIMDSSIYGHTETKEQIVKIFAHTTSKEMSEDSSGGGHVFALQGPPGVGKTDLIKNGIAKAFNRPCVFISLGGASDGSYLNGHGYTYEGSNHGRIVEALQQAKTMNPVICFDELDKVSESHKGQEIINILMHLTDSTQNTSFNDKYLGPIDLDLSKAIIIFSYNDESKISKILLDRMKIIRVKGYKILDKIKIARDFLIPNLQKQVGIEDLKINISDNVLEYLIETFTNEGGVRKLKENINDIFMQLNLVKLQQGKINNKRIKNQFTITKELISNYFLKKKRPVEHLQIIDKPKVGIVNGLWANDYGVGGLVPIEAVWYPSTTKYDLKLTGMQGDVMKESMQVSKSVAWKLLPEKYKTELNTKWLNSPDCGIHVHCPDGATPKDGPSAGGAITVCLLSLLTGIPVLNTVAMTGEINLKGQITAIGGLEEKIFGAKKAGANHVLCPLENKKDLDDIKSKYPDLINDEFHVETVSNIQQIIDIAFVNKL